MNLNRSILIAAGALVLVMSSALPRPAWGMPSFSRQTGLTCNSCHIGYTIVPLFTRTARLFQLRGYHLENTIKGKLREEGHNADGESTGHYGGNYLALNWHEYFSARVVSQLASGGQSITGEERDTESDPASRITLFFVGPITDWLGVWTEIGYIGNQGLQSVEPRTFGNKTNLNLFAFDEFRLIASWDLGPDSFWGMSYSNEQPDVITEFNYPLFQVRPWNYGQSGIGNEYSIGTYSIYGFWNNRWFTQASMITGDFDTSWSNGNNKYLMVAYDGIPWTGNRFRKNSSDVWTRFAYMWGSDQGSMVNARRTSLLCPTDCPPGVSDLNFSFSNTLGGQGEPLADLAQFNGTGFEIVRDFDAWKLATVWAVADMGVHSWYQTLALAHNDQQYVSGAEAIRTYYGYTIRYLYNRTYGFGFHISNDLDYDYTDPFGVEHSVYSKVNWGGALYWMPAMNVNVRLGVNPFHNTVLDPANYLDEGLSWRLTLDMAF